MPKLSREAEILQLLQNCGLQDALNRKSYTHHAQDALTNYDQPTVVKTIDGFGTRHQPECNNPAGFNRRPCPQPEWRWAGGWANRAMPQSNIALLSRASRTGRMTQ